MNLFPVSGETQTVTISFAESIINLTFTSFENDIDMDQYTAIDYSNLYSELITISPLINRVGIWRAQAEAAYDDFKLECGVYESQIGERLIKELSTITSTSSIKVPGDERVKRNILLDDGVVLRRKKLNRLKLEFQILDNLYWALKEKGGKLNRISESMSLAPADFESNIIEGAINGYIIKKHNRDKNKQI